MRVRCVRVFLAALLVEGLYVVPAGAGSKNFVALLNGGQETPANNSGAFGVAFLTLSGNSLCYSISFTRLDGGAETNAHVHGPAAPGTPSSSVVALTPIPGNPKNGCITLATAPAHPNKKDLKQGMTYVNIHSHDFPGGEIRGQVIPVK